MAGGTPQQITKIAIIGTGMVGSTFAYSLMSSGLAEEIVLIDTNKKRASYCDDCVGYYRDNKCR